MYPSRRVPLVALALTALGAAGTFAPSPLAAQAASKAARDSMAFPRQVLKWFQAKQADSIFSHASEQLKASMKSPADAETMMGQMASRFGAHKSTDAEVQFDDQGNKVFIWVSTYATAPEQVAIIVRYTPGKTDILGLSIGSLSRAKERFPAAKLP